MLQCSTAPPLIRAVEVVVDAIENVEPKTGRVTLSSILDALGPRSFGSVLLLAGHFWLPRWLLDHSIDRKKVRGALTVARPVARSADRSLLPRLLLFVRERRS